MSDEVTKPHGPWVKGVSGNPGGRTKEQRAREMRHAECIRGLGGASGETYIQVLHDIAVDKSEDPKHRIASAKLLLERGYGKAPDVVQLEGGGVDPTMAAVVAAARMTPHERRQALAQIDAEDDE